VPLVLGSASTYVRAGIGGLGRLLQHDDFVPLGSSGPPSGSSYGCQRRWMLRDQPIRVILGPQQECFTEEAVTVLLNAEFRVSKIPTAWECLDGSPLRHRDGWDIVSDAIATGAVQVRFEAADPPLADHQTTGGYPRSPR
jgi:allophanate hydrolase